MRTETDQPASRRTRRAQGAGQKQPDGARKAPAKAPSKRSPNKPSANKTSPNKRSVNSRSANKASAPPARRVRDLTAAIDDRLPTREAEDAVDRIGEQIGHWAGVVSHALMRTVAIAREEVEDMVAEAQSIRENIGGPGSSGR